MFISKRRIFAADDIDDTNVADTNVDPEASDLLFEAEDVAELVAEVTGQPVDVTADEDAVTFAVGEDEYTVQAEGDEEVLEATRRPLKRKKTVAASSRKGARRTVSASTNRTARRPAARQVRGKRA